LFTTKKQRPGTHSTLTVGANDYSRPFCSFYLLMTIGDTVAGQFFIITSRVSELHAGISG
jgi:hypothetical protein